MNRVHIAAKEKLKRTQQLMGIVEGSIERGINAELSYSSETAATAHALINSYERGLMRGELIGAYNILKGVSDTLHKLYFASCSARLFLNGDIADAALAEERVERNRTIRIESIVRKKRNKGIEYNQEHRERKEGFMKDFAMLGERIIAILEIMGVTLGSGVWISSGEPSIEDR